MKNFARIAKNDLLIMSDGNIADEREFQKGKYPYFLSTTQNSNPRIGFQSVIYNPVRITLDSNKMSHRGKFMRVSYFHKDLPEPFPEDPNFEHQSEDRFLTMHPFLKDFHRYFLALDVYIEYVAESEFLANIRNYADRHGIPLTVHGKRSVGIDNTEVPIEQSYMEANDVRFIMLAAKELMSQKEWNGGTDGAKRIDSSFRFVPASHADKEIFFKYSFSNTFPKNALLMALIRPLVIRYMKEKKTSLDLYRHMNHALHELFKRI